MAMYQFLVAVRSGPEGGYGNTMLTNEAGEVTSHIQGMFNRTIKMMTSGIKPVYVFDGKPPQMKSGELAKRLAKRAKAEADLQQAMESGVAADVDKYSRRLVKVNRQHNEDCKELLRLMGVPVVDSPCEAEAQCAEVGNYNYCSNCSTNYLLRKLSLTTTALYQLAKKKKVFATATEDMDALTFRTPKLLRKLTFSQQSGKDKQPILEIDFEAVIRGLELTYEQFVDLCILCGCDYCATIKGIGPKTALKLIKTHKNIETIVTALKKEKKYEIPADWFEQRVPKKVMEVLEAAIASSVEQSEVDAHSSGSAIDAEAKHDTDASVTERETVETSATMEISTTSDPVPTETTDKADGEGASADAEDVVDDAMNESFDAKTDTEATPSNKQDSANEKAEEEVEEEDPDVEYETVLPMYVQARKLFLEADVLPAEDIDLKWREPDEEGLKKFLIERMGFNADRVSSGIKKLKEAQQQKSQQRMDM